MTTTRNTALLLFAMLLAPRPADACKASIPPQVQATCHVTPGAECVQPGEPVTVSVTITNVADPNPPYQSDQTFEVFVSAHDVAFLVADSGDSWGIDDDDGDGALNFGDNCPQHVNEEQGDFDGDGVGDRCDNCPIHANAAQFDGDMDGIGDDCDVGGDADGDLIPDAMDNCPTVQDGSAQDGDADGVGDACDNCPAQWNPEQQSSDSDGLGDDCDNCPLLTNPDQEDGDGDGQGDRCTADHCSDGAITAVAAVTPPSASLVLDDIADPAADEPTSAELNFVVTPEGNADGVLIDVVVRDERGRDICVAQICVLICQEIVATPRVALVDAQQFAPAGGQAEFEVLVERNGYPSNSALDVTIIRENHFDPEDLFPIDPPELLTQGFRMTGESGRFRFGCGVHGPCYPGISNVYHAVVRDVRTGQVVRDTRSDCPNGLGRITVDEARLADQFVLEVLDQGGSGYFSACEGGQLRMRFLTRNAHHGASLENVLMEARFPTQLSVVSWTLRVHDNPLDSYDPTPAELSAVGLVTELPGRLRVEAPEVEERFPSGPSEDLITFRDMLELDVLFQLPFGGLGEIGELVFEGVDADATRLGQPVTGSVGPLALPIGPNAAPEPYYSASPASPLLLNSDGYVTWDDEPSLGADTHSLFRGDVLQLWEDEETSTCERFSTGRPTRWRHDDPITRRPELFPDRGGWFYLVRGSNCAGDGSLGTGSRGSARPAGSACP